MENKTRVPRRVPAIPALALLMILLGLLMMFGVFHRSQQLLVDSQDGQLMKTAQSVDNNIMGHFVWYCSDLEYVTSRRGFLTAEEIYLSGGGPEDLLYHLRESPLPKTLMIESMLVLRKGRAVLSTGGGTSSTAPRRASGWSRWTAWTPPSTAACT